jgi:hypothetical protein
MTLPTERLTVTLAEHRLLKPGLDVLANTLASAKEGHFPHRHPWHRSDWAASDVYKNQEYDADMAARTIRVRGKLWDRTQSRKIYVDAFELSALALALRISRSQKLVDLTESSSREADLIHRKIEIYRKRAKRSATARLGASEYQAIALRWRRFVDWTRYNCLYLTLPKRGNATRANLWKEQRLQLDQLFRKALTDRFYEVPSDKHMSRLVTLATTSLRRSRYSIGLRDILISPQAHTDFLAGFIEKRVELERLPGAPVPAWQAASDRGDKFREFQEKSRARASIPANVGGGDITSESKHRETELIKTKAPRPFTHNRQPLTEETLLEVLGKWLYTEVTIKFNLTQKVCLEAQYQIAYSVLDQYRVVPAATSLNGVVEEMRPTEIPTDDLEIINFYVDWLLKILLALRQEPRWIYQAVSDICGRAIKMQKEAHHAEWAARIGNGSLRDALSA